MKVAVVGATGLVGQVMLKVLEERGFPLTDLIPVASERSVGKQVEFKGKSYTICSMDTALERKPDIALFSAGGATSLKYAKAFAEVGCKVIDNSSAWRRDSDVPLVVPEVNGHAIGKDDFIIANPNCSTIQLMIALAPLQKTYGIKRLVISTYQSVTGSGVNGITQLETERSGNKSNAAYPHPIDYNVIPHGGDFMEDGYTSEEDKLRFETRKILEDQAIAITATVVRVPVVGGHSESVNIQLGSDFNLPDVLNLLKQMPGLIVQDDVSNNVYPMPIHTHHRDEVFVGRIRRDTSVNHGLDIWVVADNLRKGAATNAVQIAEYLVEHQLV